MKLYRAYRTDAIDWDEFDGFIISAKSESEAKEIADKRQLGTWKFIRIKISDLKESEIIFESFRAG